MGLLADLVVKFTTQGVEDLDKASAGAKAGMEGVGKAADTAGQKMVKAFRDAAAAGDTWKPGTPKKSFKEILEGYTGKAGAGVDADAARAGAEGVGKAAAAAGKRVSEILKHAHAGNVWGAVKGVVEHHHARKKERAAAAEAAGGDPEAAAAGAGAETAGVAGVAAGVAAVALAAMAFKKLTDVIGAGASSIMGMVQAGIQASGMGQILNFQWERLTRVLAGAFAPEIQRVIAWVEKAAAGLSRIAQSDAWARLMDNVDQVMDWIGGAIDPLLSALEAVVAGVVDLISRIRRALGFGEAPRERGGRGELARPAGGTESVEDTYRRIARASVMAGAGKGTAEKQLEVEQAQLEEQKKIKKAVEDGKAPVK